VVQYMHTQLTGVVVMLDKSPEPLADVVQTR
jgi:hypothetical protein